jgi:hypothetical protein
VKYLAVVLALCGWPLAWAQAAPQSAVGNTEPSDVTESLSLAKTVGDAEQCGLIDHGTAAQYLVGIQFYWWHDLAGNPTDNDAQTLLNRLVAEETKEFASKNVSCGNLNNSDRWITLNQDVQIGLTFYQQQTGTTP